MSRLDREVEAKRAETTDTSVDTVGFPTWRKGPVYGLARQSCFSGESRDVARSGDISDRGNDEIRVPGLESLREVGANPPFVRQDFRNVEGLRLDLSFDLLGHFLGPGNVLCLRGFVAAAKQDDHGSAAPQRIDAISGTLVDAHFADALSYRLTVAEIALCHTFDPHGDFHRRAIVAKLCEPIGESFRLAYFDHVSNISYTITLSSQG